MNLSSITLSALFISACLADAYMHVPRGSNNRLNEASANRANGNRLFDSQNNNRGGYNVGELGSTNGFANNQNAYATDESNFSYEYDDWANDNANGRKQFEETFLEGSILPMSWTVQHGCGNEKNNCNLVIEYTCDSHEQNTEVLNNNNNRGGHSNAEVARQTRSIENTVYPAFDAQYKRASGMRVQLKNGANTNTPDDPNNIGQSRQTANNNDNNNNARTESEEYYAYAKNRDRNQGLFTADQNLQGDDQTKTRQNPGGTRRGLEVPEERDYFPWWNPSPWRPVAIIHNDVEECTAQMALKSSARETKYACVPSKNKLNQGNNNDLNAIVNAKTLAECQAAAGGDDVECDPTDGNCNPDAFWYKQLYNMDAPECVKAPWTQVNNLGNAAGTGDGGLPATYNWNIPTVQQFVDSECFLYETDPDDTDGTAVEYVRIQMRFRYNMTTMDYDPYETTAACNQNANGNIQSPVQQNPTVDVGVEMQGLKLALNTAQTGRTFQDRSHVMRIQKRPAVAKLQQATVKNVVIQGKRGNIVQTFPAVEYDFYPKTLELKVGECAAFQWAGSNTHNNGNPAGDGQAGDAGEGRGGSDRSNLVQLVDKNSTYPMALDIDLGDIIDDVKDKLSDVIDAVEDKVEDVLDVVDDLKEKVKFFFEDAEVFMTYSGSGVGVGARGADGSVPTEGRDAQAYFMSGGFYNKEENINQNGYLGQNNNNQNAQLNVLLNNAPASMKSMTVCPNEPGEYTMASTRNNNFSNRDQKLKIIVKP